MCCACLVIMIIIDQATTSFKDFLESTIYLLVFGSSNYSSSRQTVLFSSHSIIGHL